MVRLGRHENSPESAVYLFSSGSRRLYLDDVFNTIAYPPGFVIQFRYREPWVDNRITHADCLEGSKAIIVSCPQVFQGGSRGPGGSEKQQCGYNYYPLRRGTIVRAKERGGSIHVYCKLGPELVKYPEKCVWSVHKPLSHQDISSELEYQTFRAHPGSHILKLTNRPRMGKEDDANDVFISLGPDLGIPFLNIKKDPEQAWIDQEDEWVQMVEFLAKDPFFKGNLFYRLTEIEPISNTVGYKARQIVWWFRRSRSPIEDIFTETAVGFKIDSGGQYQLNLSLAFAGSPPDQARKDRLALNSTDFIDMFPDSFNLGFRTDERSIIVNPKSVGRHYYSVIEIETDIAEDGYTAPRLDIKLDLYPTLARRMGVPLILVLGVMAVIVSGPVAGPISDFATQQVSGMAPEERLIDLLLTLLGLTITTIGFRLYRSE